MAEYIDVLDVNGIPTGTKKTRAEIHRDGDWHQAVIVAILNNKNRVLLQRRAPDKDKYPNMWDISLAAHVSAGNDSVSTIIRENNEEIGIQIPITIKVSEFRFLKCFRDSRAIGDFKENQFYDLFAMRLNWPLSKYSFNDGEVSEIKFADYTELIAMERQGLLHPRTQWIDFVHKYITNSL